MSDNSVTTKNILIAITTVILTIMVYGIGIGYSSIDSKSQSTVTLAVGLGTILLVAYAVYLLRKLVNGASREAYSLGEYYKLKACRCGTEYDTFQDEANDMYE